VGENEADIKEGGFCGDLVQLGREGGNEIRGGRFQEKRREP